MQCPSCQTDNGDGAIFCIGCGSALPLPTTCPACGKVSTSLKFCTHCGHKFGEAPQPPFTSLKPPTPEPTVILQPQPARVKLPLIVAGLVAVLVSVGGGYYFMQQPQKPLATANAVSDASQAGLANGATTHPPDAQPQHATDQQSAQAANAEQVARAAAKAPRLLSQQEIKAYLDYLNEDAKSGNVPKTCGEGIKRLETEFAVLAEQSADMARLAWPNVCVPAMPQPRPVAAVPALPRPVTPPSPPPVNRQEAAVMREVPAVLTQTPTAPPLKEMSIDQIYQTRAERACGKRPSGAFQRISWTICAEPIRMELCSGKWHSANRPGMEVCRNTDLNQTN